MRVIVPASRGALDWALSAIAGTVRRMNSSLSHTHSGSAHASDHGPEGRSFTPWILYIR
jgi:hypothetical protein